MTSQHRFLVAVMNGLVREFARWVAERPRTYAETMEAWSTHCPGLPVWEDARDEGLVTVVSRPGGRMGEAAVTLTDKGRALAATP
jgi:hypothetical protein